MQSLLTQSKLTSFEIVANEPDDADSDKENTEEDNEKILLAPYDYICQNPGRNVKPQLIALQAFNCWLKIPNGKLKIITDVIQMLHNARLLIDDMEDYSTLPSGIPVSHNVFGILHTVNSANYVYFVGLQKLQELDHPDVNKLFTAQMLDLHQGHGMDIYWRNANVCPTEHEYLLMILKRTGGLFGLGVKLMQLFSENDSDFKHLISVLVCYFQIREDYASLISNEYSANRIFAEDLTKGRFSFPIVHAIRSNKEDDQIISILRQKLTDVDIKKYCVELISRKGSLQYTILKLKELQKSAYTLITRQGGNHQLIDLISELKKVYEDNISQ